MTPDPVTPYDGNYASLPAPMLRPPVEGNRTIPVNIIWAQDGVPPGYSVGFDATARQTSPITQIAAVYIDNTNNRATVGLVFPDTNFELTVAANTAGFFPVVTNGLRFTAWPKLLPTPQDQTLIEVLNFLPPALGYSGAPTGIAGGGTVIEIDTAYPIVGGPINTEGTIGMVSPLPIPNGGTGAATSPLALANLGAQVALTPAAPLGVTQGGTGANSAPAALANLGGQPALTLPLAVAQGGTGRSNLGPAPVFGGLNILSGQGTAAAVPSTKFALDDSIAGILAVNYGGNPADGTIDPPSFYGTMARGTVAVPLALRAGDVLMSVSGSGYGATGWGQNNTAGMLCFATQDWTDTAQGTVTAIYGTPNGSAGGPGNARITVQAGLVVGEVTAGGDQGIGTVNATAYYISGIPSTAAAGTRIGYRDKVALYTRAVEATAEDPPSALPMQVGQTALAILCINNGAGLQLQDVTLGPPDSGGLGFRALRVPN